jgi:pyridoxine 5-phosphate synthase
MVKLSVNINKVATLRNSRGGNIPNLTKTALDCEIFGAQGITVHPRPDERHIRYSDVYEIKDVINTELNIEGYPDEKFISLVRRVKPSQVTLVPDAPDALTSNQGWDVKKNLDKLTDIVALLKSENIRTSVFVETDLNNLEFAARTGTDRIELFTGQYAGHYLSDREKAIEPFIKAAEYAQELGLDINAGHDLSLENLTFFATGIKRLKEVSIGHALICDALYFGLKKTISMYKDCLK